MALGSGVIGPANETYAFDGLGRMTQAQSADVITQLTCDSLSRVVSESNAGRLVTYDRDVLGNPTRIQYPSGFALRQTFDELNRPVSIGKVNGTAPNAPFEEAVSYAYRGPDLVATKSLFNGLAGARSYDASQRLLDETFQTASGQTVFRERLAWTPRSLKAAQSRSDLNNQGLILAYDGASRLLQAGKSPDPLAAVANNTVAAPAAVGSLPNAFAYSYDQAQNLLSRTEKKNDIPEAVALPLDNSKRNRPAAVGAVALEWDANGNMTRKGDLHFQYDYRNRLTRVTRGTGEEVATYQYDAFNRRIKKTVGSENRETAWRGWQPIEEYKNGGLDQRRIYGLDLDEIVQLQVDLDGNGDPEQKYAPLYDSTGNLVEITGTNGKPAERYEYTPYGQRKILVDSLPPAVEQVRVKGSALWVEMSEGISQDVLAKAVADHTLTLTNLATQQPIVITVTQPVVTGRQARRRLVITTTGPPAAATQVRLTLPAAALQDSFLNQPAQDYELTFAWPATDAVLQDTQPIQLQRVAVHDGLLEIELSEEPDLATTSAIQIDGAPITWTLGDDRYTLTSANPLTAGSHALAIGTALADLNGGLLAAAYNSSFNVTARESLAVFEAPDPRDTAASTVDNLFGFQGHPVDPETGLIYFRNRYYDPELGRFITADPKGYVDGPSRYAFEVDDPANESNPLGLCKGSFWECLKDGAKETLAQVEEFVAGVGQGLAGSINPNAAYSQPSDSDTKTRRVGQGVGDALAFVGGGDVAIGGVAIAAPACIVTLLALPTGPIDLLPAGVCVAGGGIAYAGARVLVNSISYAKALHEKGTSSGESSSSEESKPSEGEAGEVFEQKLQERFSKKIIRRNEKIYGPDGKVITEIDFETDEALVETEISLDGKIDQLSEQAEIARQRGKRLDIFYDPSITPKNRLNYFRKVLAGKFGNRVRFIPTTTGE